MNRYAEYYWKNIFKKIVFIVQKQCIHISYPTYQEVLSNIIHFNQIQNLQLSKL